MQRCIPANKKAFQILLRCMQSNENYHAVDITHITILKTIHFYNITDNTFFILFFTETNEQFKILF